MTPRGPLGACLLAALLAAIPAAAQSGDDDPDDHEEQDRRYYERYTKPAAPPAEAAAADPRTALLEAAESLIRDKNYRSAEGPRFRVQSDDPRLDVRATVELLEAFRDFFDASWGDRATLLPVDDKIRVFLFYSYHDYDRVLAGDWSRSSTRPKGHYGSALGAVAAHTDSDRPGGLSETLVHETAHALIGRRLLGEVDRPAWLDEGLATYYGFTAIESTGGFLSGEVGGKRPTLLRGGVRSVSREPEQALKLLRERLRARPARAVSPFLSTLDAGEASAFHSGDLAERYAASWVLVHFLLHGDGGMHAAGFARWLARIARGDGALEGLLAETGLTRAELGAGAERHLATLKAR